MKEAAPRRRLQRAGQPDFQDELQDRKERAGGGVEDYSESPAAALEADARGQQYNRRCEQCPVYQPGSSYSIAWRHVIGRPARANAKKVSLAKNNPSSVHRPRTMPQRSSGSALRKDDACQCAVTLLSVATTPSTAL